MKKIIAIGEALIDFIPNANGKIKEVESFEPHVGGAPCNVCGAYAKLGGKANLITQLGNDPFGDKIVEEMKYHKISTDYISRTNTANTSLAFVALTGEGDREFSFYRKPGADMLLTPEQIKETWFEETYALHFCSVSLGQFPMKEAHKKAIEYGKKHQVKISFDPNVRLPLWEKAEDCRDAILEFIPFANVLKISDEEIEFITGEKDADKALETLFVGHVELILYTCGSEGSYAITKTKKVYEPSLKVKAIDTTGAGDAFIGSILYQLSADQVIDCGEISQDKLREYIRNSAKYCAASVQEKGAISSYPTSL